MLEKLVGCFFVLVLVLVIALFVLLESGHNETADVYDAADIRSIIQAIKTKKANHAPIVLPSSLHELNGTTSSSTLSSSSRIRKGRKTSPPEPPPDVLSTPTTTSSSSSTTTTKVADLSYPLPIGKLLGVKSSPNSYVTLIHGIDNRYEYRGYLYNALIMRKALRNLGSTADFIVLLGFTTDGDMLDYEGFVSDLSLLENLGIRIFFLPRLLRGRRKVSFAEMALLKITPWSFTDYQRIQYLDGDVLPTRNLDCFFQFNVNTFNTGNASPLNSGWYLALPDLTLFTKMREKAIFRLSNPWDETNGWGTKLPRGVTFRNHGKDVVKWDFNGASLDQGLLFDTLCLNEGSVTMLDHSEAVKYLPGYQKEVLNLKSVLNVCDGYGPMDNFVHFTGQKKPWLQDLGRTGDSSLLAWKKSLDELGLPINSSTYQLLGKKIPLGFWHPNK